MLLNLVLLQKYFRKNLGSSEGAIKIFYVVMYTVIYLKSFGDEKVKNYLYYVYV